ncbi:hypothetical protein N7456_007342 [Penicillium angulare]|uniref:BZIP transcription factor n=1 Tax=Penicillium angulare TaxID=116970 RepID=A0A9W9FAG4_9EURO|nr:hypothetical protein N7456_007342 [Penicillium angulare]
MTPSSKVKPDPKKRLRDRRAQQSLRDRRNRHLEQLEERVALCEREHHSGSAQSLFATINDLQNENNALRAQMRQVELLTSSWSHKPTPSSLSQSGNQASALDNCLPGTSLPDSREQLHDTFPIIRQQSEASLLSKENAQDTSGRRSSMIDSRSPNLLDDLFHSVIDPSQLTNTNNINQYNRAASPQWTLSWEAPWSQLPLHQNSGNAMGGEACFWLTFPELIAFCPAVPSALDLLYHTRQNFLANAIAQRSRQHGSDVNRLGFGWLVYVMCKWLVCPNPSTFSQIPTFFWPVESQIKIAHPKTLDFIIWPSLRAALIENWTQYNLGEVLPMLARCIRTRWTHHEDFLEPDFCGSMNIRQQFLDSIQIEEGWMLSMEFVKMYPDLTAGLSRAVISKE